MPDPDKPESPLPLAKDDPSGASNAAGVSSTEIEELAAKIAQDVYDFMPRDSFGLCGFLMECTRVVDYWTVEHSLRSDLAFPSVIDLQLIQSGWNAVAASSLQPLQSHDGVPFSKSNTETELIATTVLHQLGRAALLRRTAEMMKAGMITATRSANGDIEFVAPSEIGPRQASDRMEVDKWISLEAMLGPSQSSDHLAGYRLEDASLDEIMSNLVFPWAEIGGSMTGYNTRPDVDDHFTSLALGLVVNWRHEAGLSPETRIGGVTAGDLTVVATHLIGLHMKHIRFVAIAARKFPQISILESLTIWKEREKLIDGLRSVIPFKKSVIRRCLELLALRTDDGPELAKDSYWFRPLLLDLGNGYDLYPVSSAFLNPFTTVRKLLERRYPSGRNVIAAPREAWLRRDLYALFQGTRYRCIEGNIKLRSAGRESTDLDAVIYDVLTQSIAIFQIKWQDFDTNDVKKLRSKGKNFVKEIEKWATCVTDFCATKEKDEIRRLLRLRRSEPIMSIHLFALSRSAARFEGYGYGLTHPEIAVAIWPQFCRLRFQIGAVDDVFSALHEALRLERGWLPVAEPHPVTLYAREQRLIFQNLWQSYENLTDNSVV